jgi:hypothetical protein
MSLVPLVTSPDQTEPEPKQALRIRVGGEARYYFNDGVGAARVNHGPWVPIPRHTWIGYRAGAETFDGFSNTGIFADLMLGTSFVLGTTAIGMYGGFGISREAAAVYPYSGATPPTGTVNTYGITIGMSVAFGG